MENLFEKTKKTEKSKAYSFITGIFLIFFLFGFWLWYQIYTPYHPEDETKIIFDIKKEESLANISSNLKKSDLIKSEILFSFAALTKGVQGKLQAGTYSLSPSMSISEILNKLSSGDIAKERITVIEGWNLRKIGNYFQELGICSSDEFINMTESGRENPRGENSQFFQFLEEFDFLKDDPEITSLEGYLFPDTYEIKKGEDPENIVRKMLMNFDVKVNKRFREEIENQKKTLSQVVIMASILEKEVQDYNDKKIAAGILWKRIKNRWRLQVDATLTYLTGKGTFDLSREDLEIDSPYNTYKYYGLPPGPICNPGLESIKAAINYTETDFWYYLTTKDGKTEFSKTLEEHNLKRFKYLR